MSTMKETILAVTGMTCGNCVRHVDAALKKLEGVEGVEVSLASHIARIRHRDDAPSTAQMTAAIVDEGYGATMTSQVSVGEGVGP